VLLLLVHLAESAVAQHVIMDLTVIIKDAVHNNAAVIAERLACAA
jgi:hypothetical protein